MVDNPSVVKFQAVALHTHVYPDQQCRPPSPDYTLVFARADFQCRPCLTNLVGIASLAMHLIYGTWSANNGEWAFGLHQSCFGFGFHLMCLASYERTQCFHDKCLGSDYRIYSMKLYKLNPKMKQECNKPVLTFLA